MSTGASDTPVTGAPPTGLGLLHHPSRPLTVPRVQGEPVFGDTIRTFAKDDPDISAPGLGYVGWDVAASKPARIRVLVVEVGHQPQPQAFLHGVPNQLEPPSREVLSHQARPRVQEDPTISQPLMTLEHTRNPSLAGFSFVLVVEDQQWGRPVIRRRRTESFWQRPLVHPFPPHLLSDPHPTLADYHLGVKYQKQACIKLMPPLQYERAKEGFEWFRTKTARSIII